MSTFLQALYKQAVVEGKDDLSIVPEDAIKDIKKNIRDGAADLEQDWANAMELTHKAYSVAGVERPTPSERSAWTQYEEMLQLAVNELADARKLSKDKSWRMSSTVFKEAMEPRIKVRIVELGDGKGKGWTTEAKNLDEIIEMVRKQAGERGYDMDVSDGDDGKKVCTFSEYGIKRNYRVTLQRL
jgi:hypothetical protein